MGISAELDFTGAPPNPLVHPNTRLTVSAYATLSLVWTIIEPCIGVISACLPTLRPIVKILFGQDAFWRSTWGILGSGKSKSGASYTPPATTGTSSSKTDGDDGETNSEHLNEADLERAWTPKSNNKSEWITNVSGRTDSEVLVDDPLRQGIIVRKSVDWQSSHENKQ